MREQLIRVVRKDDGAVFELGGALPPSIAPYNEGDPPYTTVFMWAEEARVVKTEERTADETVTVVREYPAVIRIAAQQLGAQKISGAPGDPLPGRAVALFDVKDWSEALSATPPEDLARHVAEWRAEQEAEVESEDEEPEAGTGAAEPAGAIEQGNNAQA
jgi:hypothetical protein